MSGAADEPQPPVTGPQPGPGQDVTCTVASRAVGEPVEATAPHAVAWVGVVVPGPWPRDVRDRLPRQLRVGLGTSPGVRVVLVRPAAGRTTSAGLLLAGTLPGRAWLREVPAEATQDALDALADPQGAAVTRLSTARDPGLGTLVRPPAVLVCVDEACDRCCARYGRPAATELHTRLSVTRARLLRGRSGPRAEVWECSGLDGGRFAPTAALLPSGMLLGGLGPDPDPLADAVEALMDGRPAVDGYRGRSTYPASEQAAEAAVRRHLAVVGISAGPDDLRVDGSDTPEEDLPLRRVLVRHTGGRTFRVLVEPVETDALRPATCGSEATPVLVWSAEVVPDTVPGVYVVP